MDETDQSQSQPNFGLLGNLAAQNSGVIANLPQQQSSGTGISSLLSGLGSVVKGLESHFKSSSTPTGQVNNASLADYASRALGNGNPLDTRPRLEQMVSDATQISEPFQLSPAYQSSLQAYNNAKQQGLTKSPFMTVVDFSKPATSKRLWVVNPQTGQVLMNTYVAQGAPGFSNIPGSHQSSLGTFVTGATYNGHNGYSLRIQGLDKGVNDNAASRDIVVHGSSYASTGGHSWGCFAVPEQDAQKLINLTQGGSIIHAYAPDSSASSDKHVNFLTNPTQAHGILNSPNNNPFRPQQVTTPIQGINSMSISSAAKMIANFEGFQSKASWDVNAYRTGYGSDTYTTSDGKVHRVMPDTAVSQEDAERDLERRTGEFQKEVQNQIGQQSWSSLPQGAQDALTSMAYNYGSLPSNVVGAVKTGNLQTIAAAVELHAHDNHGVNKERRMQEAQFILNSGNQQQTNMAGN